MSLPVEFEVIIPLFISCFFSLVYELDREENLWSAIVAAVCWLTSGMVFLVISAYPEIALLFNAVGIIYIVRLVAEKLWKPLTREKSLTGGK